ncbi:DUF5316 family protein [Bacillus methanolicus]|uniref:Uncharacterized protein n=1 Tax=Bacillus methanolicus (strain MGA3 / ATCC 53907) TaxID=796606 RepID=I3E7W1_BACMM|nr:DUF5316 family protein [Bacillus methanolicus]AIE59398.1 hypothetical protein BMMGA3_04830 [Bacillus methanolicus MGA3]EIJ82582.1 YwkF [Bacillus methanolicus MGA3]
MYKYFFIGLVLTIINLFLGVNFHNWNLLFNITALAVLIPFMISGILIGAFVSGDRMRGNFYSETKEDRESNRKWASKFF